MVNELKGNITEQFLTFTEEVHLSTHLFIHSHLLNVPLLSASYLTGSLPDTMDRNVNIKSMEELPAGRGDSCKLPIIMQCVCCCCSVTKLCLTLCDPVDYSMPGFPDLHYLPEFAQTHVHWVDDAIYPSHPLLPPSLFVFSLFQHHCVSCYNWAIHAF